MNEIQQKLTNKTKNILYATASTRYTNDILYFVNHLWRSVTATSINIVLPDVHDFTDFLL